MTRNQTLGSFLLLFTILSFVVVKKSFAQFDCILIENATYYDVVAESYVSAEKILLRGNLIESIVPQNHPIENSGQCKTIEGKNKFILPGFIDSHSHVMALDAQRVTGWQSALEISAHRPKLTRMFLGQKNLKSLLLAGITSVRDLGNSGYFIDAQLHELQERNAFVGSRLIFSGPGMAVSPTQINSSLSPAEYAIISSEVNLNKLLKTYTDHSVRWIKLYADNSDSTQSGLSENIMKTLVQKAHVLGLKVAIHAENKSSIQNALAAGADSIEHFYEIPTEDNLPLNKPYVVLTDFSLNTCTNLNFTANCTQKMLSFKTRIEWLTRNGFKLVFGSDAVLDFSSKFKSRGQASLASLQSLEQLGLSPKQVIKSATATAAEMLQLPIGKIANSFYADLVFYDSDPIVSLSALDSRSLVLAQGAVICQGKSECQP